MKKLSVLLITLILLTVFLISCRDIVDINVNFIVDDTVYATVDADTGANHFVAHENGLHKYVIKARENDFYKKQINELLKK